MSEYKPGSPLTIIAIALVALAVLSMLPWGRVTGNRFKDFNLLSDLLPESDNTYISHEEIDPQLAALTSASVAEEQGATDTTATDTVPALAPAPLPADFAAPTAPDGTVLPEDYSPDGSETRRLAAALGEARARPVRIAVIGDSYIEGDIFTQDVRSQLQTRYGGRGVGYMAAHSEFPGFRQSVRQTSQGWTECDMRHIGSDPVKPLSGVYFKASPGATVTYKGSHRPANTEAWDRSTILFIAPGGGTVTLATDNGEISHTVEASPDVQALRVEGTTARLSVTTDIAGLKMLGAWLDSSAGISLDCMSMRGNSGITHRHIDSDLARQMRAWIDYDLIIFEYGINALSSAQTNYDAYAEAMTQAVRRVRAQYPRAVVMVLGIGDRGQKQGAAVGSIPTAEAMTAAQRDVARRTGSIFWDTRAAMGGRGSVVQWHDRKLVNADYIHLNHKGGAELARIFVNSLLLSLNQ